MTASHSTKAADQIAQVSAFSPAEMVAPGPVGARWPRCERDALYGLECAHSGRVIITGLIGGPRLCPAEERAKATGRPVLAEVLNGRRPSCTPRAPETCAACAQSGSRGAEYRPLRRSRRRPRHGRRGGELRAPSGARGGHRRVDAMPGAVAEMFPRHSPAERPGISCPGGTPAARACGAASPGPGRGSRRTWSCCWRGLWHVAVKGGAGAGAGREEYLELADDSVEAQADAVFFGDRLSRCRVQKAWATETRVTWWCQPGQVRPSKWARPVPVWSRGSRSRCAGGASRRARGRAAGWSRAGWRARTAQVRPGRRAIRPAAGGPEARCLLWPCGTHVRRAESAGPQSTNTTA